MGVFLCKLAYFVFVFQLLLFVFNLLLDFFVEFSYKRILAYFSVTLQK